MRILMLAAVMAGVTATAASAQDFGSDRYFSLGLAHVGSGDYDYNVPGGSADLEMDSALGFTGALGMGLGANMRVEAAFVFAEQDVEGVVSVPPTATGVTGSVQTRSLDLNGYYDFPVKGRFRPYVGAGLGVTGVKVDDGVFDDTAPGLKLQVMAGGAFKANDKVSIFVEGRWQRIGNVSYDFSGGGGSGEDELEFSNGAIVAGVRVGF